MARGGARGVYDDDRKQKIGDGVAKTRRKPVGITSVSADGGATMRLAVLWSDGEVEVREVEL